MRSADITHCIRAGQYYGYCCYSSQSLRADLQSLLLPSFLFMEEAETGSWWDLQDLFFIIDFFQSLTQCFFPFLKHTRSCKDKSKAEVLFLNRFLYLFFLSRFHSLYPLLSKDRNEWNSILERHEKQMQTRTHQARHSLKPLQLEEQI